MLKTLGLRPRLFGALFLVALVPLLLLALVSYDRVRQNHVSLARDTVERVSRVQQRRLNLELQRLGDSLVLVASRTQMRLSLRRYNQTRDPAHLELMERILRDALEPMAGFAAIWIRDPRGELVTGVAAAGRNPGGPATPPAFAPEAEPVQVLWDGTGAPRLWLSGPLLLEGEGIGSVHILARFNALEAVLGDFSESRVGGRSALLMPVPGQGVRPFPGDGAGATDEAGLLVRAAAAFQDGDPTSPGPFRIDDQWVAIRPLAFDLGHVLVHTSLADVANLLDRQVRSLLATAALALALSLVMALVFARSIARPVEVMTRATHALREGRRPAAIRQGLWGEFIDLARSFNYAMEVISRRTEDLSREVEARRRSQRRLADLANTDPLTGLVNRRHFMAVLAQVLQEPPADGPPGALLYLDLDGFKPVNDRLGHEAGDLVLETVAARLRHLVREQDMAARIGGDEFALLLVDDGSRAFDPEAVAARAEEQVSEPLTLDEEVVEVGCSVGVVRLQPGEAPQAALSRADAAMYRVKTTRRN